MKRYMLWALGLLACSIMAFSPSKDWRKLENAVSIIPDEINFSNEFKGAVSLLRVYSQCISNSEGIANDHSCK